MYRALAALLGRLPAPEGCGCRSRKAKMIRWLIEQDTKIHAG